MATGLVIHVESPEDKHTEVLTSDRITIGTDDECQIQLVPANFSHTGVSPHKLLELSRTNGSYHVTAVDPAYTLTLGSSPISIGQSIQDGDVIHVSDSDLSLQFFPIGGVPATLAPVQQETRVAAFIENAAIESAATARRDDAKVFLREFTRELVREISLSTKLLTLTIAVTLVGGVLYLGYGLYRELQKSRDVIDRQNIQIGKLGTTVDAFEKRSKDNEGQYRELLSTFTLAPDIRARYGNGVCLIYGSFYFVEKGTGRPLRYLETQTGEDGTVVQSGSDATQLTAEGNGAIAEFEFVGSGFFVGDGFVLTNRHVAQPWLADERAQTLTSTVNSQPRLKSLAAFFPNHPQSYPLKFRAAAAKDDLAVCSLDTTEVPTNIPVLPLDKESDAIAVGMRVIMMGYPSGPDRLLALLDDSEARNVQARYGSSLQSLLGYLGSKSRIQPLTTQGNITDLDAHRIVYDAKTAEGGSGAPLFGQSAKVIGINFAVFTENSASNFAVPARAALSLLERAGWKPPVTGVDATADGANANQNANKSAQGTSK